MSLLKLTDLNNKVDRRTSLLVLPSIDELFSILETEITHELRIELYKIALQKWHDQIPLFRLSRVFINSDKFKFRDTFELYAQGVICVDEVEMIPTRVISINGTVNGLRRNHVYQDNVLHGVGVGNFIVNAIYKRPLWYKINPNNELDPNSAIGFLEERHVDRFVDQCLVEILDYVITLKNNFQYPSLPVEVFNGIDNKLQELRSQVTEYLTTLSHAKMYR